MILLKNYCRFIEIAVICSAAVITITYAEISPIVTVEQGQLQGNGWQSRQNRSYFEFLGVPFGEKPERFQMAKFPSTWEGVRNATEYGPACANFDITFGAVGDEDCLTLNIFTRSLVGNMSVMVFIHGGGFNIGQTDSFKPQYFMDENVVLVTINYRTGAFGFLSTEDNVIQGNYGLKDQVLALKWIQRNIDNFGGDATRVTIFGESAGGASVHYLMISPLAQGLFSRAISQSGSALNPWAFQEFPRQNAEKLTQFLNCSSRSSTEIKECLMSKTTKEIVETRPLFEKWSGHPLYPFAPSVEVPVGNGNSEEVFLSDMPEVIMREGKFNTSVPWITGINEFEGIFYVGSISNQPGFPEGVRTNLTHIFPIVFMFDEDMPVTEHGEVTKRIQQFYFQNQEIDKSSEDKLAQIFSDRYFNHGIIRAAQNHVEHGGIVFPYIFTLRGDFSWDDSFFGPVHPEGATHCDELIYLFNLTFGSTTAPALKGELLLFSERFIKLWISFANTGTPDATWNSVTWPSMQTSSSTSNWLKIDKTSSLIDFPYVDRVKFWDTVWDAKGSGFALKSSLTPFILSLFLLIRYYIA